MAGERVIVIGAGPGGLTAAMILAHRGFQVDVYEKRDQVGGRNGALVLDGGFTFDIGPTFLMMLWILEEVFEKTGRQMSDYLDIRRVDPLYRLIYGDGREFSPTHDEAAMKAQMDELFPGEWDGFQRYLAYEKKKLDRLVPCLQVPYGSIFDYARWRLIEALPYLDAHKNLFGHLGGFFGSDPLKLAFTFQAKYLGMSPWDCPATFSMISYIEHAGGIHHPIGGLNRVCHAMAKVVEEEGGTIHLNAPVERILVEGGRTCGVQVAGVAERARHVVCNADFGHAMTTLVEPGQLRAWGPAKLDKAGLSCSIYMLYLGVDKRYDIPHHNIFFANDYQANVHDIAHGLKLSDDFSFYVQNACETDPTLAPEGKSTLYVLVPVPNNRSGIDWSSQRTAFRDRVVEALVSRAGLSDLREHIEVETAITPGDWEQERDVYRGAVFNLAHTIDQMLWMRPHNAFEGLPGTFLAGGGTHPGSGLPTIYQSGMISADLISKAGS